MRNILLRSVWPGLEVLSM